MSIHVYAPECIEKYATSGTCPDCKQRTRFLSYSYEWFEPDCTCIKCGRSFNADGWVPLPFVRGSRQKEIARAKRRFKSTIAIGVDAMIKRMEQNEQCTNET